MLDNIIAQFTRAAENVGAEVHSLADLQAAIDYLVERVDGELLVPPCPSIQNTDLAALCKTAGLNIIEDEFRQHGASAGAGLSGANFGIAATGTIVLESTEESVRIATTLPDKHFVLLDPRKLLESAEEAVPLLEKFHQQMPQAYLAYITGPSRTADIERVLTIGVHGPSELHILLLEGLSDDLMER